jgi:hypothetical protein
VTDAGERLEWKGTLAADPVSSAGEFQVEGIVLKRYTPYLEGLLAADLTDGKLSLSGNYEVNLDPASKKLLLRDAALHLRDLKIAERPAGSQVIALGALDVSIIEADAVAMKAELGGVSLTGGHVSVRRNTDGSINLLSLAAAAPPAPAGAPARPLPDITVADVGIKDFAADVEDRMVPHAARMSLGGIQVSLRNFSLKGTGAMPLDASFAWAPKGAVRLGGTVVLNPAVSADLKADVTGLDLLPLSPYLEQLFNARLSKGSLTFSGKATASLASGAPQVAMSGDLRIESLGLVDAAKDKELAGFALLSLAGVRVETGNPLALAVSQVELEGPYARVRVNEDGSLNIASLVVPRKGPSQEAAPAGPAPRITVASVNIKGGDFSFSDHSIAPNVRVSLGDFSGTLKGLSSENMAKADLDLKGSVDGTGPVAITGTVDPLGEHPFVGLKIDVRNVDLVPFSSYSGRFAGYELARGQLVVDSKILVDGDKVDATDVVTLNQFTFGSATSSPVATALPVRLGVALLKDTEGKIVIDLPIQGSLSDPDFRVGKVVLRVVVNLLTKAAVSPFALVGSMFGGGGDELSFQEFAPGDWKLRDSEIPKLATLAKALANRPSLNLGMEGGYDAASDSYALRRRKLDETVRRRIWDERHATDPTVPPPEALVIPTEAYTAMVKKLFDAAFPPGTQFGTPLPPEPAAPPPPPKPAPGFLRRVVDFVTFQKARDERAAQRASKERAAAHEKEVSEVAAKGLPLDQMEGRLAEAIPISEGDLASLALSRAQSVRSYLVESAHIGADRLFLTQSAGKSGEGNGPRVFLTLE